MILNLIFPVFLRFSYWGPGNGDDNMDIYKIKNGISAHVEKIKGRAYCVFTEEHFYF